MATLAVLAKPLVVFFLTEKWLPMVPYFRWLCLARVVTPVSALNMNILNANGRSDLFLKLDLSKLPLSIIIMLITVPFGVDAVVIGNAVGSLLCFFINAWLPGKLYGYGPIAQMKDICPMMFISTLTAFATYQIISLLNSDLIQILTGGISSIIIYYLLSYIIHIEELKEFNNILKSILIRILVKKTNVQ